MDIKVHAQLTGTLAFVFLLEIWEYLFGSFGSWFNFQNASNGLSEGGLISLMHQSLLLEWNLMGFPGAGFVSILHHRIYGKNGKHRRKLQVQEN